tara:strand:- start:329 stop:1144 length:816 start_codon:yes stop_codon:yes gene_type:complete
MTKSIKKKEKLDIDIFNEFGKLKSFGGKTLNQNLELTRNAIAEIQPLQKVFDRQHSQFQTTFFIVGKHATLGRSIRQIVHEIHFKEEALLGSLKDLALKEVDMEEMREKIVTEENKFERKRLELNINHGEISRQRALEPIQAAMRDILILKKRFDEIHKDMSEKEIEEEEVTYWIIRLCSQAMRHVRQSGRIDEGNQLALEQIGINPHYVQKKMQNFLANEQVSPKADTSAWSKELASYVKELKNVPKQYARIRNMDLGIQRDAIYEEDFN